MGWDTGALPSGVVQYTTWPVRPLRLLLAVLDALAALRRFSLQRSFWELFPGQKGLIGELAFQTPRARGAALYRRIVHVTVMTSLENY